MVPRFEPLQKRYDTLIQPTVVQIEPTQIQEIKLPDENAKEIVDQACSPIIFQSDAEFNENAEDVF